MSRGRWATRLGALATAWAATGAASADVATDGTVGRRVPLSGPDVEVGAELGRVRGRNLFHSFEHFDVPTRGRVTFTGPSGLDNVVSRVTGGEPSTIDGTLASTVPGADVYLVNPSGIVFGPNARLDVPSSFHASTADELRFSDGVAFSAADPGRGGLSVARPEAFGFLGDGPGAIAVDRGVLEVPAGEALSLVGGDVTVAGGTLRTAGGRLTLTAFGGPGEHVLATGEAAGNVSGALVLTGGASAVTTGEGGGAVLVRGGRLTLEDRSSILAGNTGPRDASGGIAIEADAVTVGSGSLVATGALDAGAAGPVTIRAGRIELRDGGRIASVALATGGTGPVTVDAARLTVVGDQRPVSRELDPEIRDLLESAAASGDLGALLAIAGELAARATGLPPPDGEVVRLAFARGLAVVPPDAATGLPPFTGINAATFGPSAAAPVAVQAAEIELRDGLISSDGFGPGAAGPVTVAAERRLLVDGTGLLPISGVVSAASGGAEGAGRVTVTAGEVEVRGGVIGTSPIGQRGGGTVLVEAGRLLLGGGGDDSPRLAAVESSTFSDSGRGGSVTVRAGELEIRPGGVVNTGTFSDAAAGEVTVEAGHLLVAGGGRLTLAAIASNAISRSGDAGGVTVAADTIELRDGGRIASASIGSGAAGNVRITVGDTLAVDHARVSTFGRRAEGGRIEVAAGDLILLESAEVTSSGVEPAAGASLITLQAPLIVLLDGSRVTSLTGDGAPLAGSGEARVLGDLTFISADSEVLGSSTVELVGVDNEVGNGLRLSPGAFLDAGALLGEECAARRGGRASSFTRAGRGGLPPSPDRPLSSANTPERGQTASVESGRLLVAGLALSGRCGGLDPGLAVR